MPYWSIKDLTEWIWSSFQVYREKANSTFLFSRSQKPLKFDHLTLLHVYRYYCFSAFFSVFCCFFILKHQSTLIRQLCHVCSHLLFPYFPSILSPYNIISTRFSWRNFYIFCCQSHKWNRGSPTERNLWRWCRGKSSHAKVTIHSYLS